jgi:hypothetical protein
MWVVRRRRAMVRRVRRRRVQEIDILFCVDICYHMCV